MIKTPRRAVHGVLLLDKPLGLSSHTALQRARGLLGAEKAGHTGTLDPLASGLLPLCFGAATKFSQVSLDADKTYVATLRLGQRTASYDGESPVIEERAVNLQSEQVQAACAHFTGEIEQLPPMHSALKKDGKPLYEYARAGIEVERTPRRIRIHHIRILACDMTELHIEVHCSKGTYIRTLADDIGQALGCGAHLSALRRTRSGALMLEGAVTLDQLEAMSPAQRDACVLPADTLVQHWPALSLDDAEAGRFLTGLRRRVALADAPAVRVYGPQPGAFLGSAHVQAGELIPDRLLSPPEVQGVIAAPARPSPSAPDLLSASRPADFPQPLLAA